MLQERKARQIRGESKRRWFSDSEWDLIVWQDSAGSVVGFQICYDRTLDEHALTWNRDSGFAHQRIDDGEDRLLHHKQSPILVSDGEVDIRELTSAFVEKSRSMDPELARFIRVQLKRYSSG